jgi:hypothetical protein
VNEPQIRCPESSGQISHLERNLHGTTDLAWWAISGPGFTPAKGLRWSASAAKAKLAFMPAVVLGIGLVFTLAGRPEVGLGGGLACGLVFTLAAGMPGWYLHSCSNLL